MDIDDTDRRKIAQAVRAYIARERISREEFAQRAKLGKSTVDKLVVGNFSEKTVLQIESQLSIGLRQGGSGGEVADKELGKYTREDTGRYVGDYVFARPSFNEDGVIYAFHMQIAWDSATRGLLVKESARDKQGGQFGMIYMPRSSMHIFILSNQGGWLKTAILSQLDIHRRMKGAMLTMGRAFANVYAPMAMPVIMNKYDKIEDRMIGRIGRGAWAYEEYRRDLSAVELERFASWIPIKPA